MFNACKPREAIEHRDVLQVIPERSANDKTMFQEDALHVAVATVNGMEYLLTWNLTHIANATLRRKYEQKIRLQGYEPPLICTPEELMSTEP